MRGKRGVWDEPLVYLIIGLLVLAISFVVYGIYTGKMQGALDFFNNLFRFR